MPKRRFNASNLIAVGAFLLTAAGAWTAKAEPQQTTAKAVVELFTSQGCSSCPPADALLGQLAKRTDLITLTLPVDYWDYLGWKDTLASPKFSERQRAYAKHRGDHDVYTPQMVVDGLKHAEGNKRRAVDKALVEARRDMNGKYVPLVLSLDGDTFVIEVGAAPEGAGKGPGVVWLALVKSSIKVPIERGENAGKRITYWNVVRDLIPVGRWLGEPVTIKLPAYKLLRDDADSCAVLLQERMTGPILAAAEHRAK